MPSSRPSFGDRKALVGLRLRGRRRRRRIEAREDDGLELRDGGDGQILPAPQVARRDDVRHLVAVLGEDGFVEVLVMQPARDQLADEPGDHEAGEERKLVRHFEDDEHGRHRGLHDAAEAGAHAADDEQDAVGVVERDEVAAEAGDGGAAHPAEEKARRENAAGAAEAVAGDGGEELGHEQGEGELPGDALLQSASERSS